MVLSTLKSVLRSMMRRPRVPLLCGATLALALGMTIAVFAVMKAVLLEPLSFDPERRLVQILTTPETGEGVPVSAPDYRDWRDRSTSFESMTALFRDNFNLGGGEQVVRMRGAEVTAGFFRTIGVEPVVGRGFTVGEDHPDGPSVVVMSNRLWQSRYAKDRDIVGKVIPVDDEPYTVIGVAPAGFTYPEQTDLWLPLARDPALLNRGSGFLTVIARLADGRTVASARAEMVRIAGQLEDEYPETNAGKGVEVRSVARGVIGDAGRILVVLQGAVFLVLLIAVANVSHLTMERDERRRSEMAVRLAVGASRSQLFSERLVEAVVLGIVSGAVGIVIAHAGVRLMVASFGSHIPRVREVELDLGVFLFAVVASLVVAVAVTVVGSHTTIRGVLTAALAESQRSVIGSRVRGRSVVMAAETALAVVLLVGALLMIRTLSHLIRLDPGFGSVGVVSADVDLEGTPYAGAAEQGAFLDEVAARISAQPGVESAGAVYPLPIHGRRVSTAFWIEHRPDSGRPAMAELRFVTSGYLETMLIPLSQGRLISGADGPDDPAVAVVNESFVRRFFADGLALGRRISFDGGEGIEDSDSRWVTVVGVVGDVRHVDLATPPGPELYVPVSQDGFPWATIVVRTHGDPAPVMATIRTVVHSIDANVPVFNVQTMEGVVAGSLGGRRFLMAVLSVFGVVALLMAVVGVYGVISYRTVQRTREIGVRMALGATPRGVLQLVMGNNMAPVVAGVAAGVLVAAVASQAVRGLLAGVGPTDPATFAIVVVVLLGAAGCASAGPARRVVRVDPAETLRTG